MQTPHRPTATRSSFLPLEKSYVNKWKPSELVVRLCTPRAPWVTDSAGREGTSFLHTVGASPWKSDY
ncbi:hypothetical protein GN956_G5859 [Arapaima gigas]